MVLTDIAGEDCEAQAQRLWVQGGGVLSMQQDVTEESRWVQVLDKTSYEFVGDDILVKNAGTEDIGLFENTSLGVLHEAMDINANGTFLKGTCA